MLYEFDAFEDFVVPVGALEIGEEAHEGDQYAHSEGGNGHENTDGDTGGDGQRGLSVVL